MCTATELGYGALRLFQSSADGGLRRIGRAGRLVPDCVHVNDWHTSLLPFMIREHGSEDLWSSLGSVISIHNIAYQGNHAGGFCGIRECMGVTIRNCRAWLERQLARIGSLTVICFRRSARGYAEESNILTQVMSWRRLIEQRAADLRGILKRPGLRLMDPATDPKLVQNYDSDNFVDARPVNKSHLQSYARLPVREETPLGGW